MAPAASPARRVRIQLKDSLPHLLVFGWYRPGTGFTRVLEALLPLLAPSFRISWMGVGYQGPPFDWSPGVRVFPTNLRGGDLVGAYGARLNWSALGADAIFALNDIWYLKHYSRELAQVRWQVPMVGYLPLDGKIPEPSLVEGLTGFSTLVTYTECAAQDLAAALSAAGIDTPVLRAGHGVDLGAFHPQIDVHAADALAQRMQRAQVHFGLAQPAFVVLNASRPDPRKRIDLTLEGFARFAQGRPDDVCLCLHQAITHPQFVEPLRQQVAALGISERVIWHPREPGPVSDVQLNTLYNACAVGINTALGEGFGLVSFEHAATGVPQIVPGQDALRELWRDGALFLPTRPVRSAHTPLLMAEVDPADVASALARLCDAPQAWTQLALAGWQRTQAPDLRWEVVAAELTALIQSQLQQPHRLLEPQR